jgi:TonB-linked SusC/RagA family outer membrane protein
MYKYSTKKIGRPTGYIYKILLVMRLTTVILLATLMHVSAAGLAQKISLSKTNVPLKTIIRELRRQSGYDFVYTEKLLQQSKPVDIKVSGAKLEDVLKSIFDQQPLTYNIKENTVVISLKRLSFFDKVISVLNDIVVRGRVMDENSMPLSGVTVSVKGTSRKTTSDKNGLFEIRAASPGDVLVFTSVGMQTREININNRTELIVSLTSISNELAEVTINTGYQLISREKMTGASVAVNSSELEKRYTPNILDNLEGRVPGLVNYRGTTQIRGVGTIQATRTALIVVDGLPIEGTIANINPYDVESITVLKDAAAAAIYGVRAANGVIVVTTKRAKNKGISVEFSSNVSITEKPNISYNLLSPAQQVDLESSYYSWYFKGGNAATPAAIAANLTATETNIRNGNPITPVQYAYYQLAKNPGTFTQAQLQSQLDAFKLNDFRKQYSDNVLLNNLLQQYDLAIRTNGNNFQSSLILNYKANNTGIINAYDNQLNVFYKGTYQASKWLDVNFGVNGVLGKAKNSASSFAASGTNVSPYLQLLDNNGNSAYYTTSDYNMYNTTAVNMPKYSMMVNHIDELGLDSRITKQTNTRYYVNANAKILPGLTFSPQFQYENSINNVSNYSEQDSYVMRYLKNIYYKTPTIPATNPITYAPPLLPENGGKLATTNTTSDYWTARAQLGYKKQFGKHYIDVIGGTEFRQTLTKGTGGLLLGYDDQLQSHSTTSVNFPNLFAYKSADLSSFKPTFAPNGLYNTYLNNPINVVTETRNRYNSNYANAIYTYDNKYNVSGSYRVDYANVFGLDKEYRGKPLLAAGASWNVSNESFMSDVKWVNFLKLRVSYGLTGNIPTDLSSRLVANSTLTNAVTNQPVSVVISAANPLLRWEKSATTNLGLDFSLLDNRLSGAVEWYRKKSTDVFFRTRIDPSEGFTEQIINNAAVLNNGIELSLNYSWLKAEKRNGVNWSSLLILSKNNNKVTDIDEISVTPVALVQNGYKIGYPVNSLFSLQYKGLNAVGQPQWLKADGTLSTAALSNNDMNAVVYSGGTDPKINIALTNEVYYKGFSLNVLVLYYGGHYLRTATPEAYSNGASYGGMPSYLLNSWTPTNTNTLVPGFGQYSPTVYPGTSAMPANHLNYSDAFVVAGDFIKIRNIVLGYELPMQWSEKLGSKNIKLSFQLNNPKALWTKNDIGVDPETVNPLTGVGGARVLTSYVFGINVNL